MGTKWYMTVGYPGGEYAADNAAVLLARLHFTDEHIADALMNLEADHLITMDGMYAIRPCPPDLVEWIEAGEWRRGHNQFEDVPGSGASCKVPGGWLYDYASHSTAGGRAYIPVAGAAGLTVLPTPTTEAAHE